jgi:hypothetical protein
MNDVPTNESKEELKERLRALGFVQYEGSIPFDEVPIPPCPNEEDYQWAYNSRELHRQYQRKVVALLHRKVWGVGKDATAAWEDARSKPGCPGETDLVYIVVWGMPGGPEAHDEMPERA